MFTTLVTLLSLSSLSLASTSPLLNHDFPDPSILLDSSGTYYAFATSLLSTSPQKNIQVASAPSPLGPWSYIETDPLPNPGSWTAGPGSLTWAPSVIQLSQNSYIMYYSGQLSGNNSAYHCIGAAKSTSPTGPYSPLSQPIACPLSLGGAIDPSGFYDPVSGDRFLVYKVDGNSIGHGGSCGNTVSPQISTPIILQPVAPDGMTFIGEKVTILDRTEEDGPLVEAPDLWYDEPTGTYVLFYSNHCWSEQGYSVNYATSKDLTGVYKRASKGSLIATGDGLGVVAPGGASAVVRVGGDNGKNRTSIVFHGNCPEGRCLFGVDINIGVS
ncbi:family 43 putative glycoside hydrolase [Triangularia verruculosa]|uniref:Family 43 putative glycoside hydrolase n=1 Tax=Triangularia verruculosa TaxID=2587418 RepID=A0AAN6XM99_9PEZI|nr:family 43 putative glycoside hydrolase [Triangularia verruculosa]